MDSKNILANASDALSPANLCAVLKHSGSESQEAQMKVITKARGRFKYQVQEQTTGYVYRSFPTQAEAQKYIDHTDGMLEQAEAEKAEKAGQ